MIRVDVAVTGTHGWLIATETSDQAPGSGYDWDATGTAVVVGQARSIPAGDQPERWTAWLWKQAGTCPPRGQHTGALSVAGPVTELERKLGQRLRKEGKWWTP